MNLSFTKTCAFRRLATLVAMILGEDGALRGPSWTQRPEYYPEVASIARSVKAQTQKLKPGAAPARVLEPVVIEFLD